MSMRILISADQVRERVAAMATEISEFYGNQEFCVIALGNGAVFFAVDLCRGMSGTFTFDYVAVSSYEENRSSGNVNFRCTPKSDFTGRHVLLVDDVLDSGLTMATLTKWFREQGAASVRSAVLTDKDVKRHPEAEGFSTDWSGFKMPNLYLVGCGMDVDEHERHLPYIAVVENP